MELPNSERAFINPSKLESYLLSETHPEGKSKAKLLRDCGFNDENVSFLEQSLLEIARVNPVIETITTVHGTKYMIEGILETPSTKSLRFLTVWIIDTNQNMPRFVTAYPAD